MARLRSVERAEAVLDRAARMQQFRAPLVERRLFDKQIRTPGKVDAPFAMSQLPRGALRPIGIQDVPLNKVKTEQPTVSVKQVKNKLRGGVDAPATAVLYKGTYYIDDGNHGTTADRALGKRSTRLNVHELTGEIKPPAVSLKPANVRAGIRTANTIASPLLVGANAALAYQARINQGGDSVEAMGDALIAGGETSASGMVIGAALRAANSWGFKAAASTVGRALIPLSVAGHAAGYGIAAWQRGEGGAGIAKAAGWGAINGVLPIDATVEAVSGFNAANRAYNHSHQGVGQEEPTGEGRKGWGNKARAASAASRGAKWDHPDTDE